MKKVHGHTPSHYNQSSTTVVTNPLPGHPTAGARQPVPMQPFIPGYVPHQYNPNQFFPMQQQAAPHHHSHDPHVHSHGFGNMHGHK